MTIMLGNVEMALCGAACPAEPEVTCALVGGNGTHLHVGHREGAEPLEKRTITWGTPPAECPAWCTEHTGHDDGSDNWHASSRTYIGRHWFFVSTGSLSGEPELFMDDHEGVPLEEAEELAYLLLAHVAAARVPA